jgi:hypothetical protein
MRDHTRNLIRQGASAHERGLSDSESALEDLVRLAKQHGELYPMMVDIMNHYGQILQRDVGMCVICVFRELVLKPFVVNSKPIYSRS